MLIFLILPPHPADDQLAYEVDDGGDDEEYESEFNQAGKVETPCRFCEFVGMILARVFAGLKIFFGNEIRVSDDHGYGHGLSQCPSQ